MVRRSIALLLVTGCGAQGLEALPPPESSPPSPQIDVPPGPRCAEHTATLTWEGRVIVIGDCALDGVAARTLGFDPPSGRWSVLSDPPAERRRFTATLLESGELLVAGGEDPAGRPLEIVERFDPSRDRWTAMEPMAIPRSGHTATALPGRDQVVVIGGFTDREQTSLAGSIEVYDPRSGWSTLLGGLQRPRAEHSATWIEPWIVLVSGGIGPSDAGRIEPLDSLELVDPAGSGIYSIRSWEVPLDGPLDEHSATSWTVHRRSEVLLVSGQARLVNPLQAEWGTPTGPLLQPRRGHLAAALAGGRVLVAGGWNPYQSVFIQSTEILGPDLRWVPGPSTRAGYQRSRGTLTPLPGGALLAIGGASGDGAPQPPELLLIP